MIDKKFSLVMPIRNTRAERKFTEKSIPSTPKLNPSELMIAVDAPATESMMRHIRRIAGDRSRLIQIQHDSDWNFHLCHVIWECYKQYKYDYILTCYVDQVLQDALKGLDYVGKDNNAVVSLTIHQLVAGVHDLIRQLFYRMRVRMSDDVFTGLYWIYRPFYFEDMDEYKYNLIKNGMDTWMRNRIKSLGRHDIVTLKNLDCRSFDYQNEDYPWRQFQKGIWLYVNRHRQRVARRRQRSGLRLTWSYRTVSGLFDRHSMLSIWMHAFIYQHQWALRGATWASKNLEHPAVRAACGKSLSEYEYLGSRYICDVCDWNKMGRQGTGFG